MKTKPLATEEIHCALETLAGWSLSAEGDALVKNYTFGDFREAMSFMVRVGFEAEALNHHPEWTNVYNRVAIRLNTHDADGRVTAKDVELARRIETVAPRH